MELPQTKKHALLVEYEGTSFAGFQIQPIVKTVQGELQKALSIILRESITIYCSGRTDAGVHATGQVVHFSCPLTTKIPEEARLCHSLNALLPKTIMVRNASPIGESFHARFSSMAREYEYLIWNHPYKRSLAYKNFLWVRAELDLELLNQQAAQLIGEHDFTSFTRPLQADESPMRYIDKADFRRQVEPISNLDNLLIFRIRGNAFLHNMIRIIIGTLIDIHTQKNSNSILELLQLKDRKLAGKTAKPDGLYFRHTFYPQDENLPVWLPQLESYPWMRS